MGLGAARQGSRGCGPAVEVDHGREAEMQSSGGQGRPRMGRSTGKAEAGEMGRLGRRRPRGREDRRGEGEVAGGRSKESRRREGDREVQVRCGSGKKRVVDAGAR